MHDPQKFFSLVQYGFSGAALGLLGGLLLAIVIYAILLLANHLVGAGGAESIPVQMVLFMGMGWGAVLGGIFGGLMRLKK